MKRRDFGRCPRCNNRSPSGTKRELGVYTDATRCGLCDRTSPTTAWQGLARPQDPASNSTHSKPSPAAAAPLAADPGPMREWPRPHAGETPEQAQRASQDAADRSRQRGYEYPGMGGDNSRIGSPEEIRARERLPRSADPSADERARRAKQDAVLRRAGILPGGEISVPGGISLYGR